MKVSKEVARMKCNVLWHYLEWLENEQSILFDTKANLTSNSKLAIKQHSWQCLCDVHDSLYPECQREPSGVRQLLHYLNLHLIVSEALDSAASSAAWQAIFSRYLSRVAQLDEDIHRDPVSASLDVKLYHTLQNVLRANASTAITADTFAVISQTILNNASFMHVFTVLGKLNGTGTLETNFQQRVSTIRCSTVLTYALALLLYGMQNSAFDCTKVTKVYRPFWERYKEGIISALSVSDSCLISFMFYMTKLSSMAEGKSRERQPFESRFLILEYLTRLIDKYGPTEWCAMSIDYLLEDVQYLEFILALVDYLLIQTTPTLKGKFGSVYDSLQRLQHKLVSYHDKKLFPYNVQPLLHKIQELLLK